jgi:hypothetical protein
MKMRKIFLITLLCALVVFACKDGNGNKDPVCECTDKVHPYGSPCICPASGTSSCDCTEDDPTCTCDPKEHLSIDETCDCGGTDCTACTLQIYGNVVEKNSANVEGAAIPIYKEVGVAREQAEVAAGNIIGGYGQLVSSRRNMLFGKIKEFRIVDGTTGYVKIGDQYVISINMDTVEDDIADYLYTTASLL